MPAIVDGTLGTTNASWTTAGRPASPSAGQMGYNTTFNAIEFWNGSIWQQLSSASATNLEYLVVAGGGGGGTQGGGGGAGGYREGTNFPFSTAIAYTVTVGAGGAANTNGSDSVFSTITSTGGGKGGAAAGTSLTTVNL